MIDLSTNENPLGPSPRVVEAITREARQLHRYPPRDDAGLRDRLAQHHQRGLTPAHFVVASSGSEVLDLIARTTLKQGDEAIICSPTFVVYGVTVANCGARLVDVPLDSASATHRTDKVLAAITPRTRLLYVCNPGNPTGVMMPSREFDALLAQLPPHVLVVADEVYYQYAADPEFPDSVRHIHDGRNVVIVHSFSKGYGMAGLRLGYGIGRPDLIERLGHPRLTYHHSRIALAAGEAALADQAHVAQTVALATKAKASWYREFDRIGLRYWRSEANFVLVAPRSATVAEASLRQAGIQVRPVDGPGNLRCLRISVGVEEANQQVVAVLADPEHR